MPRRALVTGGSGYLGSVLVKQLSELGIDVRVLDVVDDPTRPPEVELVLGDIRSRADVGAAVEGMDGRAPQRRARCRWPSDPELFESVNVGGTEVLLRACLDAGVAKLVHTSSSAVFGIPRENPVGRATVPHPVEAYGRAKLDAEHLCRAATTRGLDVSVIRPRTILGHGRLADLRHPLRLDRRRPVGAGARRRSQRLPVRARRRPSPRPACWPPWAGPATYNIGAEEFGTMGEAVGHLCEHAGTGAQGAARAGGAHHVGDGVVGAAAAHAVRALPLADVQPLLWFDLAPAREELGWSAQWSTDAMFADSYRWFLEHREHVSDPGSAHRRSAEQGVLRLAKRLLSTGSPHGSRSRAGQVR